MSESQNSESQNSESQNSETPDTGPDDRQRAGRRKKLTMALFITGTVVLGLTVWALVGARFKKNSKTLVYYTVARADLPITVTERGNLLSQQEIDVFCELENLSGDRSGNSGTQILTIVPNGTDVKKGDLLVEFDAAPLTDRLDQQLLSLEKARAEQIQATVKYENQITQNQTALDEAKLKVELAKLDLENYEDGDGGTFQIDLQGVELSIQEQQAQQVIDDTELRGVEMLYKLGYKSRSDLATARLSKMRTDRTLAKTISERKEMVKYKYRKTKLELEGSRNTAGRALIQVERDNLSLLAQAKASKDAADRSLKKEEERYERYENQLEKCKIHAPVDGMVTYSPPSRHSPAIHEGAFVRQRQKIMSLPSLKKMQVKTAVHESVLDYVRPGLPATVRLEGFPDMKLRGSVKSVAVLPDRGSWQNSDTKVYSTVVTIDEEVQKLKPGMTAVVDIHVDRLKDIISVPVQAIVQIDDQNWVYMDDDGNVTRQPVDLGRSNDKFVEIKTGVPAGARVVLNPTSIVDDARDVEKEISPDKGSTVPLVDYDFDAERAKAAAKKGRGGESKGRRKGRPSVGKGSWKGKGSKSKSSPRKGKTGSGPTIPKKAGAARKKGKSGKSAKP